MGSEQSCLMPLAPRLSSPSLQTLQAGLGTLPPIKRKVGGADGKDSAGKQSLLQNADTAKEH